MDAELLENRGGDSQTDKSKILYPFIISMFFLIGLGLVSLYSASYYKAVQLNLPSYYFIKRQLIFAGIGLFGGTVAFLLPQRVYKWLIPMALAFSFILMILTQFTSLGDTRMGARRWIVIGPISFQTSELVKISVLLFLANYLHKNSGKLSTFSFAIIPMIIVGVFSGMIALQRDFSGTALFLFICFTILAVGGVKRTFFFYFLLITVIPGIFFLLKEEYRLRRVIGFLYPDLDPTGLNYQVRMSLEAIRNGGIVGTGIGNGQMKLGLIPEVESDFIFSSFAEEFGLIGVCIIWLFFMIFSITGIIGARQHKDSNGFRYFLGFGAVSFIFWQALLNWGVVIALLPPTGIPFPFFSLGGTNLVVTLSMCGFIARSIFEKVQPVEHGFFEEGQDDYFDGIR